MSQSGLVSSRVVVERNYAILPPEGIPASVLPGWGDTEARILCSPAMGAGSVQVLLAVRNGGGADVAPPAGIESFYYCLEGRATVTSDGLAHTLEPGGYAYLAPGSPYALGAEKNSKLLWVRKRYEPVDAARPRPVFGNESDIAGEPFMDVAELLLKKLLPDEIAFDLAMNVFTFPPGYSLPVTETHVMEHGLYMLEGQGLYYLGDRWREVRAGDFIWMGPWCPQSFYATSSFPARYLYSKNVNRDVTL